MVVRFALSCLVLSVCAACNAASFDPKADPREEPAATPAAADFAWDGHTTRNYRDTASGLRFAVPATGYRVTTTHFDPTTPPIKLKHEIRIDQDRSEVVRVDVWLNVEQLGLADWFDKYLRFMVTQDAVVDTKQAGRGGVPAIVVRHPRSIQATARRAAVLQLEGRVVRVTCLDDDSPGAHAVFERVLTGLDAEEQP